MSQNDLCESLGACIYIQQLPRPDLRKDDEKLIEDSMYSENYRRWKVYLQRDMPASDSSVYCFGTNYLYSLMITNYKYLLKDWTVILGEKCATEFFIIMAQSSGLTTEQVNILIENSKTKDLVAEVRMIVIN